MIDSSIEKFEGRVLQTARNFTFPPTPDLAGSFLRGKVSVRRATPRWAYALAILMVAIAALLTVPEVRARLLELLRIGAIEIEPPIENPTKENPTQIPTEEEFHSLENLIAVSDLFGETSLEAARESADFPIPIPTYPLDLGQPDHVFVQSIERGQNFVILAWTDPDNSEEVEVAMYVIGPGISIHKGPIDEIQTTSVNGEPAAYIRGAHYLQVKTMPDFGVLVQAPALIWEANRITYRIEADLPLVELVRIAESLSAE